MEFCSSPPWNLGLIRTFSRKTNTLKPTNRHVKHSQRPPKSPPPTSSVAPNRRTRLLFTPRLLFTQCGRFTLCVCVCVHQCCIIGSVRFVRNQTPSVLHCIGDVSSRHRHRHRHRVRTAEHVTPATTHTHTIGGSVLIKWSDTLVH